MRWWKFGKTYSLLFNNSSILLLVTPQSPSLTVTSTLQLSNSSSMVKRLSNGLLIIFLFYFPLGGGLIWEQNTTGSPHRCKVPSHLDVWVTENSKNFLQVMSRERPHSPHWRPFFLTIFINKILEWCGKMWNPGGWEQFLKQNSGANAKKKNIFYEANNFLAVKHQNIRFFLYYCWYFSFLSFFLILWGGVIYCIFIYIYIYMLEPCILIFGP